MEPTNPYTSKHGSTNNQSSRPTSTNNQWMLPDFNEKTPSKYFVQYVLCQFGGLQAKQIEKQIPKLFKRKFSIRTIRHFLQEMENDGFVIGRSVMKAHQVRKKIYYQTDTGYDLLEKYYLEKIKKP